FYEALEAAQAKQKADEVSDMSASIRKHVQSARPKPNSTLVTERYIHCIC
ncbi:hypothetical protein KIPB_016402, partial [Kipferlia bialata]